MRDSMLADSTCLVVGGSSGLGAACVQRLQSAGANVVIADLRPPDVAHEAMGSPPRFHETDVTDEDSVREALAVAASGPEALRAVIVSAGTIHGERIVGSEGPADLAAFRRVIEVNLVGTFNVLRLAADTMRVNEPDDDGERGVIVTTSSIAASEGQVGQAAYAASKAGVAALTLPAARELGRHGLRVVTIAPGVFATPMMDQVPVRLRETLEASTPFPPRFGDPDEYAALVQHVLVNPMLNGCTLRLDGGLRLPSR